MADTLPEPTKTNKEWPKHPAGTHQLILADVIYLAFRVTSFKDGPKKVQERVALIWQSKKCEPVTADQPQADRRFQLATEFTYSVYDTAALRAFLETWLGAFASETEARVALKSLPKRVGENVIGTIVHKVDGEKTYVNIKAVSPLMEGMTPFPVAGYTRNPYWAEKKAKYAADVAAWEQEKLAASAAPSPKPAATKEDFSDFPAALPTDDDSDLPFAPMVK